YSHRRLDDLAGAVEKLPQFLPDQPEAGTAALRATGTEGRIKDLPGSGCTLVAQTPALPGQPVAFQGNEGVGGVGSPGTTQPPVSRGFGPLDAPAGIVRLEGG